MLLRNNPNKLLYCNYIAMHILLLILGLAKSALQLLTKNYLIQLAFSESMNHYSISNSKYLQPRFKMSILKSDNSKKKRKKKS